MFSKNKKKKGNRNTKISAYAPLVLPILEYGSACWDPWSEGKIIALDQLKKKLLNLQIILRIVTWETLAQHRTIARLCALFKAYTGERSGKAICDRLRRPYYLSRVDHVWKIRDKKQRKISEIISLKIGPLNTGTNYQLNIWGFPLKNLRFLETELEKQL